MKKTISEICLPFILLANITFAGNTSNHFPVNWTGTDHIIKGNYNDALQHVLKDTSCEDSLANFFKLAYIHKNLKNHSKALFLYRLAAGKSEVIAPLAYKYIGEIEQELGRTENSLSAYRAVLQYQLPNRYKYLIFEKIRSVLETDTTNIINSPWLEEYRKWAVSQETISFSIADQIDTLAPQKKWSAIDSLLNITKLKGDEGCRIAAIIYNANPQISDLKGSSFFSLALASFSCKRWKSTSQFLTLSKKGKDFIKTVSQRSFHYLETQLSYQEKKYQKVVSLGKDYIKKHGNDPDLIMSIARSYRNIGKPKESNYWYDLYTKLYPSHSRSQEIVWLKAWQMEDKNLWRQAATHYREIITKYPKGKRVDESYLRHALCYYRIGQHDSALTFLERFTKNNPNSSFFLAGCYWKAKSLLALKKQGDARGTFRKIVLTEPHDYYAHRSSQELAILGDTVVGINSDTAFDLNNTLLWLDSISPSNLKKTLTRIDSINYLRGLHFSSIGAVESADFFLEPLELSYPGNLVLQFKLALAFTVSDAPAQAYRIARRLAWRIPQDKRSNLPGTVYSLLYPSFYSGNILKEARSRNVDPLLVSAVIRQESIFNSTIVSPAGAIGLMQIMPYTGEYIAKKLGEKYVKDSLSCPVPNIRFGIYYLKELLDRFDNNKVMTLASYNAGPHNAEKWYKRNKDREFDLFVEDIGFTETRNYVKKVLGNYWSYQQLIKSSFFSYNQSGKNDFVLNPLIQNNIPAKQN